MIELVIFEPRGWEAPMKRSYLVASILATFVLAIGVMLAPPVAEATSAANGALAADAFSSPRGNGNLEAQATKYKVWVAGKQVTSANAKDVLGNGTVSFNAKSHTLTLKNARISKAFVRQYKTGNGKNTYWGNFGIKDDTGKTLVIKLVGKNTIKIPSKKSPVFNYGIDAKGSVILAGSGSLSVAANKAQAFSMGIQTGKVLTLQGSVKVTAKGAPTKVTSSFIKKGSNYGGYGIAPSAKLVMKGSAQLIASGPSGALYQHANPAISFGSGYTPQVKAGSSASAIKVNKLSPAKSVYTKYKYLSIAKAKASTGGTFTITSLKPGAGSLDVSWAKTKKSSGYQIQLCTDRDFVHGMLTDVKYTTSPSGSWKGIAKGGNSYSLFGGYTYYVRGRTFDVLGVSEFGNFGKWSAVKKVKIPA